ncbi:MAG: glycosyltransferase family 2 protein [bacterium]|jgi:glycosyltransferase involved in cell wall biosynthesis
MDDILKKTLVIIPAFNEQAALPSLIAEVRAVAPGTHILIINDCSLDRTAEVAREQGVLVLDLPCNLGVGGAVQAGFRYAHTHGYNYIIRCDGDGQHPPSEIPKLVAAMAEGDVDLVVASRFLENDKDSYKSTTFRYAGIQGLALLLSLICRTRVTDPTSGFQMMNRPLISYFSKSYPLDYPEPESLALLRRQGYRFREVGARFRPRTTGVSSIHSGGAFYYMLKVGLALAVDRARTVNIRYARHNIIKELP